MGVKCKVGGGGSPHVRAGSIEWSAEGKGSNRKTPQRLTCSRPLLYLLHHSAHRFCSPSSCCFLAYFGARSLPGRSYP
eukprot:766142-Hanusia_phi.AAC.3